METATTPRRASSTPMAWTPGSPPEDSRTTRAMARATAGSEEPSQTLKATGGSRGHPWARPPPPRDRHGLRHGHPPERHEGQHVQRPDARVDAAMGAHVQSQGDGRREAERRALDAPGGAEEGEDRSVVVRIHVDVHEPAARGAA